jgi:hypothetical protein
MSMGFAAHAAGAPPAIPGPVQVLDTHWPVPVLHTSLAAHCESSEHLPHTLGPPPPQMGIVPFVQSALVQQLPGTHALTPASFGQQKSAGFEQAARVVVQAAEEQTPAVVSQIVPGP